MGAHWDIPMCPHVCIHINDVSVDIVEEFDQFAIKTAAKNVYVGG